MAMRIRSPPKHRHDGTSPLPLGMDWSPPPRKWNGQDTLFPRDTHTGWCYWVTIPTWVVLPKSRDSDPVVFYRVQICLQSPEGAITKHVVLRRFSDFLKLFADLKRSFPKKNLPPVPPKGLLRMRSRTLLDERRCSLEEWMTKLLSDIDLSRSFSLAAFLELEAAARSSFQDANQNSAELLGSENSSASSSQLNPDSSNSTAVASPYMKPDYGSDYAYEASDVGTPRLTEDNSSEMAMEDLSLNGDLSNPIEKLVKYGISNIDEGLFMSQVILEELEGFPRSKVQVGNVNNPSGKILENGHASRASYITGNDSEIFSELENAKTIIHARQLSADSSGSDMSYPMGRVTSNIGISDFSGSGTLYHPRDAEILSSTDMRSSNQVVLPMDQRHKLNRVLFTMQSRLVTAKTDMEDLLVRLNQEIAISNYLKTKVNDLEVELNSTKEKSIENLEQAVLAERERFTQMQWEMEELRHKCFEMELKLKSRQDGESTVVTIGAAVDQEKDKLLKELDATKEFLWDLQKRYEELEVRSKADVKVLVKEVKSLRSTQTFLKQELASSVEEKSKLEQILQEEKQNSPTETSWKKLLQECESLQNTMNKLNIKDLSVDVQSATESSSVASLIISQALKLVQDVHPESPGAGADRVDSVESKLRKIISNIIISNAELRRKVDSVLYSSVPPKPQLEEGEEASGKPVANDDS
ncbi:hypothetical protein SAY87_010922 [Trapa incisa]|uniref:PX domain-containing protein n=1 Tax=Trapa incisa TaxID=236973 RepID=A0AAN7JIN8_9MYRT|nr:hypothetical protein SAY87_010922 [Trapa incisa]